jgi:two-component system, NtrC family, sensor kinase
MPAREALPGSSRRVLVIDDSGIFRASIRQVLEGAGYSVQEAATGEDGLVLAAATRPDAVVVDGMLPGIDGATVVQRLKWDASLRGTPCLLLTAAEGTEDELRSLEAGADAYVRKSEDMAVILVRLAALLRGAPSKGGEPSPSLLVQKHILAVDDSVVFLKVLETHLLREGYNAVLAESGEDALKLLEVQPVDCILLDLIMPGLSGQETCRRIKKMPEWRDIPLIILTASNDQESMIEGINAGADDYISKSDDFDVLKARMRAQIRRKHFEDENRRMREQLLQKEIEATEARAARYVAETRAALVEELERKNKELEAFGYSVSHDLRAPLRSIDGFSRALLEDYADKLDAKGQDYLQRARKAALRMSELIDDLLKLSRLGRTDLRREHLDLSALARAVVKELQQTDPKRSVRFVVQEGVNAEADVRLLRVVLENLLGNAWKFTGKKDDAAVEFGVMESSGQAVFFVRDNGAGFDPANAERMFAPFQRFHMEKDFSGTGIGLATAHRIIDRHGGRIWAESMVSKGATFYWTLTPPSKRES